MIEITRNWKKIFTNTSKLLNKNFKSLPYSLVIRVKERNCNMRRLTSVYKK